MSRRLPPVEAWKHPDRWIDLSTGLPRQDVQKVQLDVDSRGFLMPVDAVEQVKALFFHEDYDWPYDRNDPETRPDDHHFHFERAAYLPDRHNDIHSPLQFRELPTLVGRMPRQFHNTIHDFTHEPAMPALEDMEHYITSYHLALSAFRRLFEATEKTEQTSRLFYKRRLDVEERRILPKEPDDRIGAEYLRTTFSRSFEEYSKAVDEYMQVVEADIGVELPEIRSRNIRHVRKVIGSKAVGQTTSINLIPFIRGARAA